MCFWKRRQPPDRCFASAVEGCLDTFEGRPQRVGFAPQDADSLEEALERFLSLPCEKAQGKWGCGRRFVEERFDRNFVVAALSGRAGRGMK